MEHTPADGTQRPQTQRPQFQGTPIERAPAHRTPDFAAVTEMVDHLWPSSLTESWDRTGPVVGRRSAPIRKVLIAVDPVAAVVEEAVSGGYDLLITHHPLLLKGVNAITDESYKGELAMRLIKADCALLTAHTNADQPTGGVSHVLGEVLGLEDMRPIAPTHPGSEEGIGRVGHLGRAMTLHDFAQRVAASLPAVAGGIRVSGDPQALVGTIAVCGGAGDSLFDEVRSHEADVYVTADLRHHPASEAREQARNRTPYLIDVSHFASEWLWVPYAAKTLGTLLEESGFDVQVDASSIVTDPWDFVLLPGQH